jgi:hypothetical protein
VCACWVAGFDPVHGMRRQLRLPADAPPGLMPTAPSRAVDPGVRKRCRMLSTGWQQPVGKRPSPAAMSFARWPRSNAQGSSLPRRPAVGSPMEGTSGAAHPAPLRGAAGGAALDGSAEGAAPNGVPRRCRTLHTATPRFHDERCPTGSGWEKTLLPSPARATRDERRPSKEERSWPVKARLASVPADAATRSRRRDRHHHARPRPRVPVRSARLAEAGPAGGARERTFGLRETGIRRSCGRARGLYVVAEVDERRMVQTERSRV